MLYRVIVVYRVIVERGYSDTIGSDMLALLATQGHITQDQLKVRTIDSGEHSAHAILEDHAIGLQLLEPALSL